MRRKLRRVTGPNSLASWVLKGESWPWFARDHDGSLSTVRSIDGGCEAGRRTSRAWSGRRVRSLSSMLVPQGRCSWSPPTSRIRATGSVARLSEYCHRVLPRLFGSPCVRGGLRQPRAPRSISTSPSASYPRPDPRVCSFATLRTRTRNSHFS